MPKQKNDLNYSVSYIVRILEEWEATTERCSQKNFAASKGINLRTFRSWLNRRKTNKMKTMQSTSQTAAIQDQKPAKANVLAWLANKSDGPEPSVAEIVDHVSNNEPSLMQDKSYHNKRRIAERLKKTAKR
jgi:hypothetical protein